MGDTDDTQKPSIQQQGNAVEDPTVESQLMSVANRIKFVLELLGAHPDKQFPLTRQYLEAELVAWLTDVENAHGLYVEQRQNAEQYEMGDAGVPEQTAAAAAIAG